jgi:redox-regulated HSP33 family molecular chaperone
MKPVRYVILTTAIVALLLLGSRFVLAQTHTDQYGGGGAITGYVLGFDMFDQLQPISWATVTAENGQYRLVAYSGSAGYYAMFVPAGNYNVTVVEPGYKPYSSIVTVSPGSTSTINVYLEQSHVPVPEFPSGMISVIAAAALSASVLAMRRRRRKR